MAWAPADDARLVTDSGRDWIVAGVQVVQSEETTGGAPRAFRLPAAVGPVAFARVMASTPLAITGGDGMARDFARNPIHELCTTLGLEQLSRAAAEELAASPSLARVRRLVVLAPKVDLVTLLAAPQLSQLESISIVEATAVSLRALGALPPSIHSLRVDNAVRAITAGELRIDALEAMLRAITAPLTRLELRGFGVPVEILAGNPALEHLAELVVDGCQLRGSELLGTLRDLRVLSACESSFDDTALSAVASCTQLATLQLRATKITDDGALSLAQVGLPALQSLDVSSTKVSDAGIAALVRSTALPALAHLEMDRELKYRAVSSPETAAVAPLVRLVGLDDATSTSWLPPRPPPDPGTRDRWFHLGKYNTADEAAAVARSRGWWPKPPLPADRRFVHRTIYVCEYCGGTGQRGVQPCGSYHRPTHQPKPHEGPLPPAMRDVVTIARTQQRFEAAEALVHELARELGYFGLGWSTHFPSSYPPHPFHRVTARIGDLSLARTPRWPFAALAAAQHANDEHAIRLFERVVAITDLGYWFGPWKDDVCTLFMHRTFAVFD